MPEPSTSPERPHDSPSDSPSDGPSQGTGDGAPSGSGRSRRLLSGVLVVVVLAVAGVAYVALRGGPDQTSGRSERPSPSASASATPTPLASLDLSDLPVLRASPCARIAQRDVETALRGPVSEIDHYGNGERTSLTSGLRDISHEFDCTYRSASGAMARVWVFAQPVSRPAARGLAQDARAAKGCRAVSTGPRFGTPTVSTRCPVDTPLGTSVSLRGLFGDAWLSCELSTPRAAARGDSARETVRRSQRWCVNVVTGLGARS